MLKITKTAKPTGKFYYSVDSLRKSAPGFYSCDCFPNELFYVTKHVDHEGKRQVIRLKDDDILRIVESSPGWETYEFEKIKENIKIEFEI